MQELIPMAPGELHILSCFTTIYYSMSRGTSHGSAMPHISLRFTTIAVCLERNLMDQPRFTFRHTSSRFTTVCCSVSRGTSHGISHVVERPSNSSAPFRFTRFLFRCRASLVGLIGPIDLIVCPQKLLRSHAFPET